MHHAYIARIVAAAFSMAEYKIVLQCKNASDSCDNLWYTAISTKVVPQNCSLRSWRDFARESFCFGSKAVNESGEAVRGLVNSLVEFHSGLRRSRNP